MRISWVLLLFWLVCLPNSMPASCPVQISEFAAGGKQGVRDEDGDTPDWIELLNASTQPVDLSGWTLSEGIRRPETWTFPATNLPPGDYLVVFASGKDRRVPGQPLHTTFKLPARHGALILASPDGLEARTDRYPAQVPGVTFGLAGAGGESRPAPVTEKQEMPLYSYLAEPTPGQPNAAFLSRGPRIESLSDVAAPPGASRAGFRLLAHVLPGHSPVGKVSVRYRIMAGQETELSMTDDGQQGDETGGDRIYTAVLPAAAAKPGQLIRYYVVAKDVAGQSSRWPLLASRPGYSAYQGLLIPQASPSRLPMMQLFLQREDQLEGQRGTRVGIFFEGEYYDNVTMTGHGQISRGFPKHSLNLRFPHDHLLRYRTNQARVKQIALLANYADKSKIRNTLAYEMMAASGCTTHFAFPVRVEKNGKFYSVAELVEHGDERWLQRVGRDPQGALYKMNSNLTGGHGAEKKTRRYEESRELAVFSAALAEGRPLEERAAYGYAHLDLPQCISYLVAMALISSDDHGHKNYYLYRDCRGSREWALLPWDVDLSWGRNWTGEYFNETIFSDNPLDLYRNGRRKPRNRLYSLLMEHPEFRQMYLRRLRTVMDELLQPPQTPRSSLLIEKRIGEWMDLIDPPGARMSDARLDEEAWPSWGTRRTAREEAQRIIAEYLPGRRQFLFRSGRAKLFGDSIPGSQPTDVRVKIDQAEKALGSSFVRLQNDQAFAVDITGWELKGGGIEHRFRPGTVLPAGKSLYVVASPGLFRSKPPASAGPPPWFVQGNWAGELGSRETPLELVNSKNQTVATLAIP